MKRSMKSFAAFMLAVMMAASTAGTCIPVEAAAKAPTKITLKATVKTVDIKGKTTVSVKSVKPKNASKSVTFKSSNKKIATVDKKGVVTGKKKGTVKITATSRKNKKVKKTIEIKVKQLTPKSISLNQKKLNLAPGAKRVLKASIKPAGVYCPVTWKSSNTAVATVDKNGKVTAKAAGTAKITVTSKEKKTVKAVCAVTVKASEPQPPVEDEKPQYMTCDELAPLVSGKDGIAEGYKVLDIRRNADYQVAHIRHSVSASVDSEINPSTNDGNGRENLEKVIDIKSDEKYVLVCYTGNRYAKAATALLKAIGVDKSRIYTLEGGFSAWSEAKTQYIEAEGLKNLIDNGYKYGDVSYTMLDVREKTSDNNCYDKGHIIGSVSATVKSGTASGDAAVQNSVKEVIKDTIENANVKYVLICHTGNAYASAATDLLKAIGVPNSRIITLQGGYNGWNDVYPEYVYTPGASKRQSGTVTASIDMSKYAKGETVRVWLQKPQNVEGYQRITNATCSVDAASGDTASGDAASGDAASGDANKATIKESDGMYYIEWGAEAEPAARKAQVTFHVERDEILRQDLTEKEMTAEEAQTVAPYLKSSSTIPVDDPTLKAKAAEITEGKTGYLGRAKAIYDWVIANMERDGSKPYCGEGNVLELLTTLKGKCTDINSVFVGLCRASGVPARERFGIRINAEDISKNQHCWAEFYLPGTGWVAADPADVLKYVLDNNETKDSKATKEKQNYYWGNCDEKRVELSNARDLTLTPAQWGSPLNTFGYPYAEVGSKDKYNVITCYDGANFVYNIGFKQD